MAVMDLLPANSGHIYKRMDVLCSYYKNPGSVCILVQPGSLVFLQHKTFRLLYFGGKTRPMFVCVLCGSIVSFHLYKIFQMQVANKTLIVFNNYWAQQIPLPFLLFYLFKTTVLFV